MLISGGAFIAAASVMAAASGLLFRQDLTEKNLSLLQGLMVLFGAVVSSALFVQMRIALGVAAGFGDACWCSLPVFASLIVTGRCIIFRLTGFIVRMRKKK